MKPISISTVTPTAKITDFGIRAHPRRLWKCLYIRQKVTVWCALSAQGIIGPFFFEDCAGATVTVNSDRYLTVLERFWRALNAKCVDTINLQWFQQDGAPSHTSRSALDWLNDRMENRIISRRAAVNWPVHSPDLTPLDFYP